MIDRIKINYKKAGMILLIGITYLYPLRLFLLILFMIFILVVIGMKEKALNTYVLFNSFFVILCYMEYIIFKKIFIIQSFIFTMLYLVITYDLNKIFRRDGIVQLITFLKSQKLYLILAIIILIYRVKYFILVSPDGQSYYLTALSIARSGGVLITVKGLKISNLFLRRQFMLIDKTSMITVYPLGGIIILSLYIYFFGAYYHVLYSIINYVIMSKLATSINKRCNNKYFMYSILFSPLSIYYALFDVSVDIIAMIFFIYIIDEVNSIKRDKNDEKHTIYKIFHILFTYIIIYLIKISTFIFISLYLISNVIINIHAIKNIGGKIAIQRYRRGLPILIVVILMVYYLRIEIYEIFNFYFVSSKIIDIIPLFINNKAFFLKQFLITNIQLLVVFPITIPLLFQVLKHKNKQSIVWTSLFFYWEIIVFIWHSVTKNPFAIGTRYFLPIGLSSALMIKSKVTFKKVSLIFLLITLLLNIVLFIPQHTVNKTNSDFVEKVYENTPEDAIILTSYYSKIIINRNVVVYSQIAGVSHYNKTEILNLLYIINDSKWDSYFIPDGVEEAVNFIKSITNLSIVFIQSSPFLLKQFSYLDSGYPRILYHIDNVKYEK